MVMHVVTNFISKYGRDPGGTVKIKIDRPMSFDWGNPSHDPWVFRWQSVWTEKMVSKDTSS